MANNCVRTDRLHSWYLGTIPKGLDKPPQNDIVILSSAITLADLVMFFDRYVG